MSKKIATREAYGKALAELAKENENVIIFVVEEDICVGKSKAKANKKYGDGGATQYYIRDMDKPKLTSTANLRSFRR